MSIIEKLISDVKLPELYYVERKYNDNGIKNIEAEVFKILDMSNIKLELFENCKLAVGVGSRGINSIDIITKACISWFKAQRAIPFIVPCMGSHGGATEDGQIKILAELGITENSMGCEIKSSMDVVELGKLLNYNLPVYMDKISSEADKVFVINRVKPHTSFDGEYESGLVKMLTIGLGKQRGADSCHNLGFKYFYDVMPKMTELILEKKNNILGGLAIVENQLDHPCKFELIKAKDLLRQEPDLLKLAKSNMPSLPVADIDVLLVDELGKNISGSGMDPNITGRFFTPYKNNNTKITKIGVLRLTSESNGNAVGIGGADIISKKLHDKINYDYTYANVITSTVLRGAFTPLVMNNDFNTIRALIKTCNAEFENMRFIRIKNTLTLNKMYVSKAIVDELKYMSDFKVTDKKYELQFDKDNNITSLTDW